MKNSQGPSTSLRTSLAPIIMILIIVGILVLGTLGSGIYWWQKFGKPAEPIDLHQGSASSIDTSNWKIYRNDEYGFEVKYPDNFEVRDLTSENKPYVENIALLIGLCDTRFIADCSGTTIHIYNGKFREPSVSEGTVIRRFRKNDLTLWLAGNNQILSTFKSTE